MKNYLKTLIVFLLVFVLAFTFVSCNNGEQTPDPGEDPGNGDENEGTGDNEEDPDNHENDYRIRFVYSYTALVTNDNGRDDYKKEVVTVDAIYISKDNNGLTAEQIAEIKNFSYNGYTFVSWYGQSDWNTDTQTGIRYIPPRPIYPCRR